MTTRSSSTLILFLLISSSLASLVSTQSTTSTTTTTLTLHDFFSTASTAKCQHNLDTFECTNGEMVCRWRSDNQDFICTIPSTTSSVSSMLSEGGEARQLGEEGTMSSEEEDGNGNCVLKGGIIQGDWYACFSFPFCPRSSERQIINS